MINIILIGPQGSGKGTQAEFLLREYGLKYIEMGSMIRARTQIHDKKAQIINHLTGQKGELLPDGIVLDMLYNEIEENRASKGYLFDGFPRSEKQYGQLKEFLKEKDWKLNAAIYLHLSDDEAIKRLTSRRICNTCKKGYSLFLEPQRIKCDCGGELVKRTDDQPEAIKKRLVLFHEYTDPVLELLKKDQILIEINGDQSIDAVSRDIKDILSKMITS